MSISDPAVVEVLEREGYLKDDGKTDTNKIVSRITEIVVTKKALNRKEREAKSITRGDLVAEVFPSLLSKDQWDDLETTDRLQVEAVYREIDKLVWSVTSMSSVGRVQRAVALAMGNGYILCRAKLGKDGVDALYITDDLDCISSDVIRPANDRLEKAIQNVTRDREMLVYRQPHHGKTYASGLDRMLKKALSAAQDQMTLAIESSTSNNSNVDDEGDEEDSE